ncbi:MAG: hypothetical protein ABII01_04665 [Candidatus Woesearchaeota archaeon]
MGKKHADILVLTLILFTVILIIFSGHFFKYLWPEDSNLQNSRDMLDFESELRGNINLNLNKESLNIGKVEVPIVCTEICFSNLEGEEKAVEVFMKGDKCIHNFLLSHSKYIKDNECLKIDRYIEMTFFGQRDYVMISARG